MATEPCSNEPSRLDKQLSAKVRAEGYILRMKQGKLSRWQSATQEIIFKEFPQQADRPASPYHICSPNLISTTKQIGGTLKLLGAVKTDLDAFLPREKDEGLFNYHQFLF